MNYLNIYLDIILNNKIFLNSLLCVIGFIMGFIIAKIEQKIKFRNKKINYLYLHHIVNKTKSKIPLDTIFQCDNNHYKISYYLAREHRFVLEKLKNLPTGSINIVNVNYAEYITFKYKVFDNIPKSHLNEIYKFDYILDSVLTLKMSIF